jgi:hypothetical protein
MYVTAGVGSWNVCTNGEVFVALHTHNNSNAAVAMLL